MSPEIRAVLEAALDRVLPGTDGAGAREARAVEFADWYITRGPYQKWSENVASGLELLDALATTLYGAPFVTCTDAQRDGALRALCSAPHRSAQRFMRLLVSLALRGFLCDPRHGGNAGEAGWRFVGLAPRAPATACPAEGHGRTGRQHALQSDITPNLRRAPAGRLDSPSRRPDHR